ncbi:hypothetical protein H6P81_020242 [Aristolochia fimbriata]|uniref:Uncharacterized protein n=1 Tax=Aristolochia fimbriata TaxID=158543 RepID=A0AAV7DTZ3_ARIFI|nr:hypothetical protein H6P81_020242 [Aristolochia fimbriata]
MDGGGPVPMTIMQHFLCISPYHMLLRLPIANSPLQIAWFVSCCLSARSGKYQRILRRKLAPRAPFVLGAMSCSRVMPMCLSGSARCEQLFCLSSRRALRPDGGRERGGESRAVSGGAGGERGKGGGQLDGAKERGAKREIQKNVTTKGEASQREACERRAKERPDREI